MTVMSNPEKVFDQKALLAEARRRAGSDDFGGEWFFEPMTVLLKAVCAEARLNEQGAMIQRERMLTGLVNRLRMMDAVRRHPEILREEVKVAGVVLGLPRTGSTMLHRLLATAPGMTAVRWWETQNYAPFPNDEPGKPVERRKMAVMIQEAMLKAVPELTAIHPFSIDAPDEEIIIMDQFFVGTMPPASMYVPSYATWLETYDQTQAYTDLKDVLKFLQWQDESRRGKRWVLKTPGHLVAAHTVLKVYPDAILIATHRDPLQTIPSYCSMVDSLYRLASNEISQKEVGELTSKSWALYLSRFAELRRSMSADRFIDVRYEEQVADPLKQVRMVLKRTGVDMNPETESIMKDWLEENAREKRAAHNYKMEDFGLSPDQLARDFAVYKAQFLS